MSKLCGVGASIRGDTAMKILIAVVAFTFLATPTSSRAEGATEKAAAPSVALATWIAEKVAGCFGVDSEEEWNKKNCGPGAGGFALAPKVKKAWHINYLWAKHCGDIAAQYCT